MNQTITIFTYEDSNIRTITTEDGTHFFCANDIATTLGYIDLKDALSRHCRGVTNHYPHHRQPWTHTGSTLHH